MGTKWSEIISDHAMVIIDDVRLQEEAANDPAAFLRRMSLYVKNAIPLFSQPVQMRVYLAEGLVQPDGRDRSGYGNDGLRPVFLCHCGAGRDRRHDSGAVFGSEL